MIIARRVSISFLMAVVGLVAADFAIVRGLWNTAASGVAVVVLPMINVLILAAPRLRRSNPARPFWLGFEVAGALTALVVGWLAAGPTEIIFLPFALINPLLSPLSIEARRAVAIAMIVLGYTPLLLLPAVVAGRLSMRYRLVVVPR